ncbi:hypothetical protein GQ473_01995, partial [archaeon]|nr:hypothetical protein [archaeon]
MAAIPLIGIEEKNNESKLLNTESTTVQGYLIMQVQQFVSGTWSVVDTVYNSLKTIVSNSELTIHDLWNSIGWNTEKNESGLYRVYAAFRDPFGNVLKNDNNENISSVYEFNITELLNLTFLEIRIYDVTGVVDPKTDNSMLWATGLNETFDLFVNHDYRFEIELNNSAISEANWTIMASDNITHQTLNSTWQINPSNDIWYANNTENFTGGNWSLGIVAWNSTLGGLVQIGNNVTFYYVFNVTGNSQGVYPVKFMVNTTEFTRTEYSTYNVVDEDYSSSYLDNGIYNTNTTQLNRGDVILVYAKWNETIGSGLAEYNSTAASLSNYTLTPQGVWTNYTVSTDSDWLLGNHVVKIYVNDSYDNSNYTLDYLIFDVWGWSYILSSDIALLNDTINVGESTTISCKVTADDTTSISGYNVSFYNSTAYLGSNTTLFSGWTSYSYLDNSPGQENLTCNITDDASKKYNASVINEQNITLTTLEVIYPKWHLPLDSNITGKIYKGQYAYFYSNWTDNFELSYGFIEWHNGTVWKNNTLSSPVAMSGTQDWANFTIQVPVDMDMPNNITWRVWANDTSGNLNVTENRTLDVWGLSTVSDIVINPDTIFNGTTTNISCRVVDENSSDPISGYFVEYWNDTAVFNTSITDSNGWVSVNYTDGSMSNDDYFITCQIYNNNTLKYDTDISLDSAYDLLHVRLVDITAPNTTNYNLNATQVNKGGLVNPVNYLKMYAEWNEDINLTDGSYVSFNRTTPIIGGATQIVSGNWTNHTFTINQSWTVGLHVAKFNASDLYDNWNNTLDYLWFTVYGYGQINMTVPEDGAEYNVGDVLYTTCNVTDEDSLTTIEGYKVSFYENGNPIGTNITNSSGIAILKVDTTGYTPASYVYSCSISDNTTIYYYESVNANNEDSATITLGGTLDVTIIEPVNEINVNLGDAVNLKSITKNPLIPITPDTAKWYNTTSKLNPTDIDENYTWTIPSGHSLGSEIIKVNVTKTDYTSDEKNITLYVWGWSNISWQSPASMNNYSQSVTVPLICNVFDNFTSGGIENYPVSFYIENETETWYLGSNISVSTGNVTYNWFVDSAVYSAGLYYPKCNMTDNSTLYYNVSSV